MKYRSVEAFAAFCLRAFLAIPLRDSLLAFSLHHWSMPLDPFTSDRRLHVTRISGSELEYTYLSLRSSARHESYANSGVALVQIWLW